MIAIIGSALQLILILLKKWFEYGDYKKEERKVLREEGIKAIRDRDVSRITAVLDNLNRM